MFKYSCFTENTPEMREWLEKIGYKKWMWDDEDNDVPFISTMPDCEEYASFTQDEIEGFSNDIDCRSNPDLFKAVSAVRDDSDTYQYFTNGVQFILFDGNDFNEFYIKMNHYHKATLTELQSHFKIGNIL